MKPKYHPLPAGQKLLQIKKVSLLKVKHRKIINRDTFEEETYDECMKRLIRQYQIAIEKNKVK
jgi:hypothetical protein